MEFMQGYSESDQYKKEINQSNEKYSPVIRHIFDFGQNLSFLLKNSRSSLLGALSSAFEWYDYALFGYFTAIFARLFFPNDNPTTALLSTFAVFASGFVMRPLGAIIFGYIGDRISRRNALVLSLSLMALPTVLLGLMPTYSEIGIWATYGIVTLRLFQGLAVGGNYGGSFIITVENAPKGYQGLAGSLATFGTLGGLFLGSGAALIVTTFLSEENLYSFGWRIPFLLGGLSSIVAYAVRGIIPENATVTNPVLKNSIHSNQPIKSINNENQFFNIIKSIVIIMIDGVGIYVGLVFITTYGINFLKLPASDVFFVNTIAMAVLVFLIPLFGYLGDCFGARRLLKHVTIGLSFTSLPLFFWLTTDPNITIFALMQFIFSVLISAAYGTLPVTIVGIFPKYNRYRNTGLAFNLSVAVFGGTAPLVITYLIDKTNILWIPGAALSLVGIFSYFSVKSLQTDYLE